MRHPLLLAITLIPSLMALGQTPQVYKLTLKQAEEMALRNHPQIAAAQFLASAADQVPIEINSAKYPSVSANLTGTEANDTARITAGGLNNPSIFPRLGAGFTVTQLISDFGRTSELASSALLKAASSKEGVANARALVVLNVDRAFMQCLRAQEILKVAEETVKARSVVAEQAEALQRSGLKSGLDVSIANYALSEANLLKTRVENDVRSTLAELANAIGLGTEQAFDLDRSGLPPLLLPPLEASVQDAANQRPELKAAKLDRDSAYQFLQAEKLLKRPVISAIWSIGVTPLHDNRLSNAYTAAGLNINIPIFNGRLFKAREIEADLRVKAYEQRVIETSNRISRDVRQAWLSADTSLKNIGLAAKLVERAREAYDLASERYRLGLSSIVELSQAQLNLTAAEIENANARFEFLTRLSVLDFERGVPK